MAFNVLVVPVYKRYWLLHAWKVAAGSKGPPPPWHQGESVGDKLKLLRKQIQYQALQRINKQWHAMETAKDGTLNNGLYRCSTGAKCQYRMITYGVIITYSVILTVQCIACCLQCSGQFLLQTLLQIVCIVH